jgi:hypothetical protein
MTHSFSCYLSIELALCINKDLFWGGEDNFKKRKHIRGLFQDR